MKFLYVILVAFIISVQASYAQDGVLDDNFGDHGIALFNLYDNSSYIYSIIKTADKIYAAGYTHPDTKDVFSIVRFNANGDLDTGFGDGGVVVPVEGTGYGVARKILLQPDGKLVAAGWVRTNNKDLYAVVRLHEDGTLDDTFGEGGVSKGSFNNSTYAEDEIYDAALLSDGKIIVTGRSYNGQNDDGFLGCIDENGDPCAGFGEEGVHIIVFEGGTSHDEGASALAVDNDDNIYFAGTYKVDLFDDNSVYVKKLNSLGEFDETFGVDGNVIWSTPKTGIGAMLFDQEGRLVIAGAADNLNTDNNDFFITRYSNTGQLDTEFGDNGIVMLDNGDGERIFDIQTLPNGDILAAGTGGFPSKFHLVRLNENGDQDLEFGDEGWATTQLLSHFNGIQEIHVNTDGSILAGGYAYNGTVYQMAFAQYTNTITSIDPDVPAFNVSVFPNPASSYTTLSFATSKMTRFSAHITDMEGKYLGFQIPQSDLVTGVHTFQIPINGMINGNYVLVMNFDGIDVSRQIGVISEGK